MELFNEYHSRTFQFALDLLATMENQSVITRKEIDALAQPYGFEYIDPILTSLCNADILERNKNTYRIVKGLRFPHIPLNAIEEEYLQYILRIPEASLFLREETMEKLTERTDEQNRFRSIQHYAPEGEPFPERSENVQTLLKAIRERRLIRYTYVTRDSEESRESTTLPWKLEHSAYDRRWWVILYNCEEKRTIKARLDNIRNVRLDKPTDVRDREIEEAMDRLMEPEPIVLHVNNQRGALERCFLVFENQLFEDTRQLSDDCFEMVFRFYRFDRMEILRQLLYIGPQVTLVSPASMRKELADLMKQALGE